MVDREKGYSYFGFKRVPFEERAQLVNQIFSEVSEQYDLMNDVMSLGLHRIWKKQMIHFLPDSSSSLLDIAGGSGDIAYNYLLEAQKKGLSPYIALCDINIEMLNTARTKYIDKGLLSGIDFTVGDAMNLPWNDNSFDYITISFGIRNVTDITMALKEAHRVLKKGGKFVCMEFSKVETPILSQIYNLYSFSVIPTLGRLIANNKEAYQYLVESIRKFPDKSEFLKLLSKASFKEIGYKSLNAGIVAIHYGYKL